MKSGILIVNKPKGLTSNDVVMKLKRKFKMREIGHTGTLDPDVEGVLVVCLGKMTKLVPFLMSDAKVYTGILTLGYTTETEDATGKTIDTTPIKKGVFSDIQLEDAFKQLNGAQMQRPPMYSAVKVKGRPLYEYARKGEFVEVEERSVTIFDFHQTGESDFYDNKLDIPFYAKVSHGTYIRTLCVDYGRKLGVASHMKELSRVQNGSMHVADAIDLEILLNSEHPEDFLKKGISVLNIEKWKPVQISNFNATVRFKIMNGAKLTPDTPHLYPCTVIVDDDCIVSFYEKTEEGYRCIRGIFEGAADGTHHH